MTVSAWELAINEMALPLIGLYIGSRYNKPLGVVGWIVGFAWAEFTIWLAFTHHMIAP